MLRVWTRVQTRLFKIGPNVSNIPPAQEPAPPKAEEECGGSWRHLPQRGTNLLPVFSAAKSFSFPKKNPETSLLVQAEYF